MDIVAILESLAKIGLAAASPFVKNPVSQQVFATEANFGLEALPLFGDLFGALGNHAKVLHSNLKQAPIASAAIPPPPPLVVAVDKAPDAAPSPSGS